VERRTIFEKVGANFRRFNKIETMDLYGAIGDNKFYIKTSNGALQEVNLEQNVKLDTNRGGVDCWIMKANN
jgi:hypothetical protein